MSPRLLEVFLAARGVSIDTRTLQAGELFFALRGPNFNGNTYAAKALELGAKAVVVDTHMPELREEDTFLVDDTLDTLQALARAYRRTWTCPVVALTGSNGKTTTKELLTCALAKAYEVASTAGNLNNHIGVPLTLLRTPPTAEVVVVEMGANHQGEIAALCSIAEPTHGFITNIGSAHLEGFGGPEGVKAGKGELFDYLIASYGCVFSDAADEVVSAMASRAPKQLLFTSDAEQHPLPDALVTGQLLAEWPTVQLAFQRRGMITKVLTHLPGKHNYRNVMKAIAVASYFKVPNEQIASAIAGYVPANQRSEVRTWQGATVLLDAYNANPDSMSAALAWLASRPEQHKIAVLGEMAELGAFAKTAHAALVTDATSIGNLQLALFGAAYDTFSSQGQVFAKAEDLREWLIKTVVPEQTVILLKGSRSNKLERLLAPT